MNIEGFLISWCLTIVTMTLNSFEGFIFRNNAAMSLKTIKNVISGAFL